jgi:hypothetical protein
MRFLADHASYDQLLSRTDHTNDCYIRSGEYLHHMYIDGIKYVIARALYQCISEAKAKNDTEALAHLQIHEEDLRRLVAEAQARGALNGTSMFGPPLPDDDSSPPPINTWVPRLATTIEATGLNRTFLTESVLRTIYNQSRVTGAAIVEHLRLFYGTVEPLIQELRQAEYIDIAGQRGYGDINYEYILTPRGTQAVADALQKTQYNGPCPVPFNEYIDSVHQQTIKHVVVTRRNIRQAFSDLVMSETILNEVGPAVNSASSIFLFGYPGNGKTAISERITRLMGDNIYLPYAVEANGQIIKLYDPILHTAITEPPPEDLPAYDQRWIKIQRPVVIVGGELTLPMLELTYNTIAKIYEAPFQMKANGGIFLIDDFGRQQCRPMDLLNRWIVPLEKHFDYLSMVTGQKLEMPFDQLIIFSTNLDPNDLADEAFLRRIKFKINVTDPSEEHWRRIWEVVCRNRKIPYNEHGIDYLVAKWYRLQDRPFRMCHPRDILDQMISMAKYNMEPVTFNPDLIDAACATYFVSKERQNFGAQVRLRD